MSQLTAALVQAFETPGIDNELPVTDNVVIYRGSAVGVIAATGYARQLQTTDLFAGFAENTVDNTVTGHASGFKNVPVRRYGYAQLSVASVAITDFGAQVYASDGNTYALASAGGANVLIGTVHRFISSGVCIVEFRAP